MRLMTLTMLFWVAASVTPLQAGGMILHLPEDGSYAKYSMEASLDVGDEEVTFHGYLILRSVGTELIEQERCRWVELELVADLQGEEERLVTKLLFPESAIDNQNNPAETLIKLWHQTNGKELLEAKTLDEIDIHPIPAFLFLKLDSSQELDPLEIETLEGVMKMQGVTGKGSFKNRHETVTFEQTYYHHPSLPFGVATSRYEFHIQPMELDFSYDITMNLTLEKTGKDAKSAFPTHRLTAPAEEHQSDDSEKAIPLEP